VTQTTEPYTLIRDLLERPRLCDRLGLTFTQGGRRVGCAEISHDDSPDPSGKRRRRFENWLLGKMQTWADANDVVVARRRLANGTIRFFARWRDPWLEQEWCKRHCLRIVAHHDWPSRLELLLDVLDTPDEQEELDA
jgi:hypothetical protein